jgi:excisionase family DNA binding protein
MRNITPDVTPLLIRSREAAKLLGYSERKLWTLTKEGKIPCVREGGTVRYRVETLRAWVEEQEKKSALQN